MYKKMYLKLFNAQCRAMEILRQAHQEAEEILLADNTLPFQPLANEANAHRQEGDTLPPSPKK